MLQDPEVLLYLKGTVLVAFGCVVLLSFLVKKQGE